MQQTLSQLDPLNADLMPSMQVLYTVVAGLVITCCFHGSGQRAKHIDKVDIMKGTKVGFQP